MPRLAMVVTYNCVSHLHHERLSKPLRRPHRGVNEVKLNDRAPGGADIRDFSGHSKRECMLRGLQYRQQKAWLNAMISSIASKKQNGSASIVDGNPG